MLWLHAWRYKVHLVCNLGCLHNLLPAWLSLNDQLSCSCNMHYIACSPAPTGMLVPFTDQLRQFAVDSTGRVYARAGEPHYLECMESLGTGLEV